MLVPFGALVALMGYFGPWVDHAAVALVVTGLDLAEYIKFLTPIQSGQIQLWREGFYLPLIAVSLALSLYAFRPDVRYGWPLGIAMLVGAGIAALNMLPPAWSPGLLITPEFRLQTLWIGVCLIVAMTSPLFGLLPARAVSAFLMILSVAAIYLPVRGFLQVFPTIQGLYNQSFWPGWGMWIMVSGFVVICVGCWSNAK